MAQYCTCPICALSVARPANNPPQGPIEQIQGARVVMQAGWTLAHWSGAVFNVMSSVEIHDFQQQEHKLRVGASFYLYQGAAPNGRPAQLRLMGLGGANLYTIDSVLGNQMEIFYKANNGGGNPAEVTARLDCGGSITFNNARQATAFNATGNLPTVTIL